MVSYKLGFIADGEVGIRQTLQIMSRLVKDYKVSPLVREKALSIVKNKKQKDERKEILAIHAFVRDEIRYVKDVRGVETLQSPVQTLRLGQGDCDDKSTLMAALLESIGYRTAFNAVGMSKGTYCHVYPLVYFGGRFLALEATEPVKAGFVPAGIKNVMRLAN